MSTSHLGDLPSWTAPLLDRAADAGEDPVTGLALAAEYGSRFPLPGGGETTLRWAALAAVAEVDLTQARVLEPHADALAILAEAGEIAAAGAWGVFAAEAAPARLEARPDDDGGWRLDGSKPWCSLGGQLDHALVTAVRLPARGPTARGLFAVDLHDAGVVAEPVQGWISRGLRTITSCPVWFEHVRARPVGGPDWYLTRPGFAWGGIGVAACWYGGTAALVAELRRLAAAKPHDQLVAMHLGRADAALHAAGCALAEAARRVDGSAATQPRAGQLLALRVRAVVAAAAETVLTEAAHALGPAPLAFDERHARRVADLQIYLRQHHAEHDLATLGRAMTTPMTTP